MYPEKMHLLYRKVRIAAMTRGPTVGKRFQSFRQKLRKLYVNIFVDLNDQTTTTCDQLVASSGF